MGRGAESCGDLWDIDHIEGDELCHSNNGVSLLLGFAMGRVWSAWGGWGLGGRPM